MCLCLGLVCLHKRIAICCYIDHELSAFSDPLYSLYPSADTNHCSIITFVLIIFLYYNFVFLSP